MRVVKEAAERRNEILDVAERLFSTRGYEATSTNDILKEIGIARGTLYYHFSSKEEILDAMVSRTMDRMFLKARSAAHDESLSPLQRLTGTVLALNLDNATGHMMVDQFHKPENALLHEKVLKRLIVETTPLFVDIVKAGVEAGIMDNKYPEVAMEMTILYAHLAFDELELLSPQEIEQRVYGYIYNIGRMMGMEEGSLQEAMLPMFFR